MMDPNLYPEATFTEQIIALSTLALTELEQLEAVNPLVNRNLPLPRTYLGSGPIRLVIIGQDPTVDKEHRRSTVKTVLTLNQRGGLTQYVATLCRDLGLSLAENIYATNACKNFFVEKPTTIQELDVLEASAPVWLPVLRAELAQFPEATVISLGQPVLSMLVKPGFSREMKSYWGYHLKWRQGESTPMRPITAEESTVGRTIFPFVHQATLRGARAEFYRVKRKEYIDFIRQQANL